MFSRILLKLMCAVSFTLLLAPKAQANLDKCNKIFELQTTSTRRELREILAEQLEASPSKLSEEVVDIISKVIGHGDSRFVWPANTNLPLYVMFSREKTPEGHRRFDEAYLDQLLTRLNLRQADQLLSLGTARVSVSNLESLLNIVYLGHEESVQHIVLGDKKYKLP